MRAGVDVDAVLRRRAEELARPRDDGEAVLETVDVLIVDAGDGGRYAFEARHVRQVQRTEQLRRLPGGAGAVLGVVPVRSGVVPVVDLAAVLGTGPVDRRRPFVVVLDGAGAPLGLLVDAVSDVTTWQTAQIRAPAMGAGTSATGGPGAARARVGPGGVVVLDVQALLAGSTANPGRAGDSRRPPGP